MKNLPALVFIVVFDGLVALPARFRMVLVS